MTSLGHGVLSLECDLGTPSLGGYLCGLVLLDASNDLLLALALVNVGDGNVDVLLDDSTIDQLLDGDTDSALVHVEDDTSATVVVLVGHTLVNGGINLDVDIVSSLLRLGFRGDDKRR